MIWPTKVGWPNFGRTVAGASNCWLLPARQQRLCKIQFSFNFVITWILQSYQWKPRLSLVDQANPVRFAWLPDNVTRLGIVRIMVTLSGQAASLIACRRDCCRSSCHINCLIKRATYVLYYSLRFHRNINS